MSLIHWWPLNGNTKDYGINNLNGSLIGSTSFDNAGKIGRCLLADTGSLYSGRGVTIPSNLVNELSGKDYSFCAWVKVNGSHVHYEGAIISSGNWNNSCWAFGLNQDNTAINPAGSWYNTSYVSYAFEVGKWYHIVSVQKSGTNYVYVNGSLVGSVGHSPISQSDASDTCIGRETYAGGYFGFNGYINDVRIYNHALSAKEVKEISKGLVLHYNFEDPYVEGTTNLASYDWVTYWNNSGDASRNFNDTNLVSPVNSKIMSQTQTTAGQSAFGLGLSSIALPSQTITVSVWFFKKGTASNDSVGPFVRDGDTDEWLGMFSYNGSDNYRDWPSGTWLFLTQTITTGSSAGRPYICCYTGGQDEYFAFTGWQIEQKNHATPYVNGTRGKVNLVSTVSDGGHTIKDGDYALHTDGTDGDTYFFLNFNKPMTFGKTYYMTCDVSGFSSDQDGWWFPICSQSYTSNRILLRNGHCSSIFTYLESSWSTPTQTILDDTSGARTNVIYITNIKVFEFPDIYDNSGLGNHGILSGDPSVLKDPGSGDYCLDLTDNGKYVKTNYMNFVNTGTVVVWAKYSTAGGSKMILSEDTSGMSNWYYLSAVDSSSWYSGNAGSITCYRDGVQVNEILRDDQWHCYAFTGVDLSSWPGLVTICYYGYNNSYQFHGKIGDIKIYNTILSAEDILLEYNRKASIDKTGKLFAPYIEEYETTGNIGELANYYIETQHAFDGRFGSISEAYYNANYPNGEPGLGTYEQGNLIVTMTNQGIRIYSEPNRDGRSQEGSEWNTWGGFCWSPMKQSRCLIKGHHYRLSWHVKGQSSRAMTDVYWSNQIGWGQYPDASPTVHKAVTHPANFQGEMDCFYDFTIEDDIFKTTTDDVHAGFEPNTSYLAYSAFKIGYTYDFTGPLGTDIYITNLQLHDLTTGDVYKIGKNGVVKTTEAISGRRDSARLHSDGVIDVTDIIEN